MRLVYIALGWVAGIILAATYDTLIPLFWLIVLGLAFFTGWMGWPTRWRWQVLALVALALGGYRYQFVPQTSDLAQYNSGGGATIEGVIVAEPDIRDNRIQIQVRAETIYLGRDPLPTDGLVLVNAPRSAEVQYGDRVRVTGRLGTPAEYDTFSYADFLARQGVFSVMRNAVVEVTGQGAGNPLTRLLLAWKSDLQKRIGLALPDPEAALLTGILLGNERGIDPHLGEAFTRTGVAHIIAISGFNMALIAGIVMGTLERFISRKWIAIFLGVAVLALYTILVGANAAVVRAAIMSAMLVIGQGLKRQAYVPASLSFVALVMSLHQPTVLWDISFQLSFFAVLGLALFSTPLTGRFNRALHRLFPQGVARVVAAFLNEPLIVSIAALITTLPLTVLYFQRLSLVSLLVNILIVPAQAYVLYIGGLALLVSLIAAPVDQVLFWLDLLLLKWSIGVVRFFGRLAYADMVLTVDARLVGFYFLAILGGAMMRATRPPWALRWALILRQRAVFTALTVTGVGLAVLMVMIVRSHPDGMLHVWWLDVGHSNAVLIRTPGGAQILVDGGRFPSRLLTAIGDRMPFHDRTIELLVISQPDEFDTAALPAVLNRYVVGAVLTNGQPNLSESYAQLEAAIAPHEVVIVRAGYTVEVSDGTLLEVLHPYETPTLNNNQNDGALVLRVTYGDVSFLLPSDLSRTGQDLLLENGQWPLADVMQLPQHGTQRSLSETFLGAVQPQVIILQSDKANRRGDPDPDTLALVADGLLLRTDDSGALHLWTDGHTLWRMSD